MNGPLGAACNVFYLFSLETDSLTGPQAVKKAVSTLMLTRPKPHATLVHFKVCIVHFSLKTFQCISLNCKLL